MYPCLVPCEYRAPPLAGSNNYKGVSPFPVYQVEYSAFQDFLRLLLVTRKLAEGFFALVTEAAH